MKRRFFLFDAFVEKHDNVDVEPSMCYCRNYFPTYCGLLNVAASNLLVAPQVVREILCFSMFVDLTKKDIRKIVTLIYG